MQAQTTFVDRKSGRVQAGMEWHPRGLSGETEGVMPAGDL